jgi:tetratricopeptide (TPR) repeat protein
MMKEVLISRKLVYFSFIFLTIQFYSLSSDSFSVFAQDNNLVDTQYQMKVLAKVDSLLETKYVLADMAEKYAEKFREKYKSGYYQSYTKPKEFADKITEDLIDITHDRHIKFRVIESSNIGEKTENSLHHPVRYYILGMNENKGFSKIEWIEGNIGYLDIRRFYLYSDVQDLVDCSMNLLLNANALIIDLRENGGGSGDYLSSYFLKYPTQLNSWYSREDDFLTEFWTAEKSGFEQLTEIPLFLLTSKRTFSAAESFAYDMKVRKRVTIIGDSTKGGAHSVDLYKIDNQFEIYIPTAYAINPVTGENWEGTGVVPDILISSESALDTAIILARKATEKIARIKEAQLKPAIEEMQVYMDRAESLFRKNMAPEAENALDSVFQIADTYGLVNEFFIDVLAYNFVSQKDEKILYAIIRKKIEFFPESPTAYESMAYAYYKNREYENAVKNYEMVLNLDPDNRNAKKMIQRIKESVK